MLNFLKKNINLAQCNFFKNFTDIHSHILYGVDDGIKTVEESLRVLDLYSELGIKKLWLTPHIMEDVPNSTAFLKERFIQLQQQYSGDIELKLSSENMLDALFEQRLQQNDFLPIGENRDYLLVETSYFRPPHGLEDIIKRTISAGYFPIMAHPERYMYMDKKYYKYLLQIGVKFQLNILSLSGSYGSKVKDNALYLLKNGMYEYVGSDIHSYRMSCAMQDIFLCSKDVERLQNITANSKFF
jgi:Capsular polysaccharide biosynthesis protein